MDVMHTDMRCQLISALHQLVEGDTRCALSERFCSHSDCFAQPREVFCRKCVVAPFAQKHREAGQGAGHLSHTLNPCRSCYGASPGVVRNMPQEPGPRLECAVAEVIFSGSWFPAKAGCPLVSKEHSPWQWAATGSPEALVCAPKDRVKVQGPRWS